jgi:2-polyprenyl-6-methoxyphenol hydroxylase-like FAD-dependent oxidoreductase
MDGTLPGRRLDGLTAAVVGGGIGGAGAALLLARAGARVTLLERVAEPRAVGAGILLQPNGLAVLYGLGLAERLTADGFVARAGRIEDAAGRTILDQPIPDYGRGLDHVVAVRRSHLFAALHDAVAAEPSIEARLGAPVTSASPDGSVEYTLDGEPRRLAADLIVAADGVHSRARAGGAFGADERRTGVRYMRGMVPTQLPGRRTVEAWTPLGLFGFVPIGDGSYFYGSARAPALAAALLRRALPALRAAWRAAYPPSARLLDAVERFDDLLVDEVVEVRCRRFVDGRIALLGDAAHAMFPNVGQGANSALVDAAVLVEELCRAPAGGSPPGPGPAVAAALARYDARRRPAVAGVQRTAARLAWLGDLANPAARWLRDGALRLAAGLLKDDRAVRALQQEEPGRLLALVAGLRPEAGAAVVG